MVRNVVTSWRTFCEPDTLEQFKLPWTVWLLVGSIYRVQLAVTSFEHVLTHRPPLSVWLSPRSPCCPRGWPAPASVWPPQKAGAPSECNVTMSGSTPQLKTPAGWTHTGTAPGEQRATGPLIHWESVRDNDHKGPHLMYYTLDSSDETRTLRTLRTREHCDFNIQA